MYHVEVAIDKVQIALIEKAVFNGCCYLSAYME
jgi:hypothetical protein